MGYSSSKRVYSYHILKSTGDSEDLQGTLEAGLGRLERGTAGSAASYL